MDFASNSDFENKQKVTGRTNGRTDERTNTKNFEPPYTKSPFGAIKLRKTRKLPRRNSNSRPKSAGFRGRKVIIPRPPRRVQSVIVLSFSFFTFKIRVPTCVNQNWKKWFWISTNWAPWCCIRSFRVHFCPSFVSRCQIEKIFNLNGQIVVTTSNLW